MKVLAINGSPRKGGNTEILIKRVLKEIEECNIETELIQIGGKTIRGCTACYKCKERLDNRCAITTDNVNGIIEKMILADAIIIGSPVYFTDVTAEIKAVIDRVGIVSRANNFLFKRKIGAAVVAARRAGSLHAYDTINHFFGATNMVIAGSTYWNLGIGGPVGDVENDEEGLSTMETLGKNIAWLLNKTCN